MAQTAKFTTSLAPPSARWMGMEVIEQDTTKMYSKVSFTPNKHMINFGGVIQGGFLTAMMDDAMGFNTFVALNGKSSLASIDLHTHFFKAVKFGPITVEAWVNRVGKSVAFVEAKLYDLEDELAARATSSTKLREFSGIQYELEKDVG